MRVLLLVFASYWFSAPISGAPAASGLVYPAHPLAVGINPASLDDRSITNIEAMGRLPLSGEDGAVGHKDYRDDPPRSVHLSHGLEFLAAGVAIEKVNDRMSSTVGLALSQNPWSFGISSEHDDESNEYLTTVAGRYGGQQGFGMAVMYNDLWTSVGLGFISDFFVVEWNLRSDSGYRDEPVIQLHGGVHWGGGGGAEHVGCVWKRKESKQERKEMKKKRK